MLPRVGVIIFLGAAAWFTHLVSGQIPASKSGSQKPDFVWPELAVLDRFAGTWGVTEIHFNARGEVSATTRGSEEAAWILDRRSLRRIYTSGEDGNLYRAMGTLTWDAVEKRFEGIWFDNASSAGPTSVVGEWNSESSIMTCMLTSTGPDGRPLQHKVVERFLDDEHRAATTYRVQGAQLEKVIEVQYKRSVPCPAGSLLISPEGIKPGGP